MAHKAPPHDNTTRPSHDHDLRTSTPPTFGRLLVQKSAPSATSTRRLGVCGQPSPDTWPPSQWHHQRSECHIRTVEVYRHGVQGSTGSTRRAVPSDGRTTRSHRSCPTREETVRGLIGKNRRAAPCVAAIAKDTPSVCAARTRPCNRGLIDLGRFGFFGCSRALTRRGIDIEHSVLHERSSELLLGEMP
jgi:hypothetical protein